MFAPAPIGTLQSSAVSADFSVVAIIAAYNEADIIDQVVADLIAQGAQVYLIDDSSTDDTVAKVEPFVGRGVIGMKIFGNGLFTDPADRDKSLKFALSNPNIDGVVIGFKTIAELDEGIDRMNRVLAEG